MTHIQCKTRAILSDRFLSITVTPLWHHCDITATSLWHHCVYILWTLTASLWAGKLQQSRNNEKFPQSNTTWAADAGKSGTQYSTFPSLLNMLLTRVGSAPEPSPELLVWEDSSRGFNIRKWSTRWSSSDSCLPALLWGSVETLSYGCGEVHTPVGRSTLLFHSATLTAAQQWTH